MKFYYSTDGSDVVGPHDARELRHLLEAGLLPPATRLCAEGTDTWKPLAEIVPANARLTNPPVPLLPPKRSRALAIGAISLTFALGILLGFLLGQHRARSSRVAAGELFKKELTKFLEEGARTKTLAAQDIPFEAMQEQFAHTKATYELLRAAWPAALSADSRTRFKRALDGWELALQLWQLQIAKADNPTEPNISSYARFTAFAPDELVVQIRDADYAVKNDRFRHFLPFAENQKILLAMAARSFDAGCKEILRALQ